MNNTTQCESYDFAKYFLTRQQEKFIVLMENYETALKYSETATNSAGTAMEKYGDYIEGIEAKMNALKAAFEKLSVAVLDSELITGSIDFLTLILEGLTNIINAIGGLNTALFVTASILAALKAESILTFSAAVKSLIKSLKEVFNVAKAAGVSPFKFIINALNQVTAGASEASLTVGILATSIGATIAILNGIERFQDSRIQSAITNSKKHLEEAKAYKETSKSLEDLIKKYKELAEKSDGIWRSSHEIETIKQIQDDITELVGDQAKDIDLVNRAYEEQIKLLDEINNKTEDNARDSAKAMLVDAELAIKRAMGKFRWGDNSEFVIDNGANKDDTFGDVATEFRAGNATTMQSPRAIIKTDFETSEDFIKQYEAVLAYKNSITKDFDETDPEQVLNLEEINEYLSEFEGVYTAYTSAMALIDYLKNGSESARSKGANYAGTALKSTSEILEEVQDGYNGITEAMANVSAEGYITADSLSTLLKLEEENALAGLKLEDILIRDAKGYKLADNALNMYIQSLIKQYAAIEKIKTRQDALNSIKNLESLLSLLTTLSYESKKDTSVNEAEERLSKQKEALNDQIDAYKELIDLRKDLLESYIDELKYEEELAERQDDVSRLRAKLTVAKLDDSAAGKSRVRELEEELKEAEKGLKEFTLEHAVDEMTQALEDQYNEYKYFIGKRIDEIAEEISKLSGSSSGSSADFSWLKTAIEEIETLLKEIKDNMPKIVKMAEIPPSEMISALNNQGPVKYITMYHSGGIVGDAHLDSNEEFAKLLKGEFVSTPSQMRRFMEDTLPRIASYTNSKESNEFNAPLVEINCDNVTTESLPELERVVDEAVKEIKKQLDSGMSRLGHKLAPTKRLI